MTDLGPSIVTGVFTFGVALSVVLATNRNQRALAREERLAGKRADAYVMLAEFTVRLRQYSLIANPDLTDDHPLMPPPFSDEDRYRMFAHVEAYGSDDVRAVYDRLLRQAVRVRTAVDALGESRALPQPHSPEEAEYRIDCLKDVQASKDQLRADCEDALRLVNVELRSGRGSDHSESFFRRVRDVAGSLRPR